MELTHGQCALFLGFNTMDGSSVSWEGCFKEVGVIDIA